MGVFRKKQNETMETTFHEDNTNKSRKGLGKWVCGSKASKEALAEDNKITQKNSSYSTSSSSAANSSKTSSTQRMMMEMENSIIASLPPPAAEAAFMGRPRFDWIDVVSFVASFCFRTWMFVCTRLHASFRI